MVGVYILCVFISLLICVWFFNADLKYSVAQKIMLITVLAANLGYLSMAKSTDLAEALLSTKIMFLGGCFLPMLFFFTVCEVCHYELSRLLSTTMVTIQTIIFAIVCTSGYGKLYYKNVEFEIIDKMATLNKEFGPLHFLYPLSMNIYIILALIVAVVIYNKTRNINRNGLISMIFLSAIATTLYAIQTVVMPKYDIMPVSYIIMIIGVLIPVYQSNCYSVYENKEVIDEQLDKIGFITFSEKLKYMGANEYALKIFPELRFETIGKHLSYIPDELTTVSEEIQKFIASYSKKTDHHHVEGSDLKIDDKTYETEIHSVLNYRDKCIGVMLEIRDITEHTRMLKLTEKYNEQLSEEVELKTKQIQSIQEKTILGMAQMVESRDTSTGGHIKRTSDVVKIFSKRLLEQEGNGLDKHFLDLVIRSAPMHDLGKIGVDDAILRKNARFTDEEYEVMKKHAEIGGRMVKDILTDVEAEDFVNVAFNVANYHHEKVNGKGYPCGLKGDEIPIEARIMALADVFDALVSKRCYKEAYSFDKAFNIIREDAGEHFDKELAMKFIECRQELENYYNNGII